MKQILLLISISFSWQLIAQNWIDLNETIIVDDTIFSKKTGLPYTGLITATAENGTITWKARSIKGLYEGDYFAYFSNGDTLQKGCYKKGKLNGLVYCYYSNFAFGETITPHCYLKENYLNGIKNGISISYFENLRISAQRTYKNGFATGDCLIYRKTGELFLKGKLYLNEGDGEWKIYNKDTSLKATIFFTKRYVSSCMGNCDGINLGETDIEDIQYWLYFNPER